MRLRRFIYIVFLFLAIISLQAQEKISNEISVSNKFDEANQLYNNKQFADAIKKYSVLIADGYQSENIFYNMGNAYYKQGLLGKSILYYEKSLKLNSKNTLAIHNLKLANTKIEDRLEILPNLFFVDWWNSIKYSFSKNTWAWISIIFSWFSVIAFAFYLFSKRKIVVKSGFYKSFIFGFISLLSLFIAGILSEKIFTKNEVVLVGKISYGRNAPSKLAEKQELFHEGTKLVVKDKVDGFYKVLSSEGNTTWVSIRDFEMI